MSARPKKWFFLRGLVREAGHWSGFLERFEAAFPDREAIPLEIPGNGKKFRERSPLSVAAMTDAVRDEFLARKGGENHLFALSLGVMIALDWLHRFPGDVSSAVLVNTSVRGLSPLTQRLRPANYARIARMFATRDPSYIERTILEITSTRRPPGAAEAWLAIHLARPVSSVNAVRQLVAAARYETRYAPAKNSR